MSSVRLPRSLFVLALAGVTLGAAPALSETLVVRASGPSAAGFGAGKRLPDGSSITLKAGDVLILLDGQGTRTLRGPGTFGASASATAGGAAIASFIGTRTASRARTGAVRGGVTATAPRSPNLWYVDVRNPATICVADPGNVKLWRPFSPTAGTLAIAGKDGKASATFGAGETVADWPAAVPVAEGASYTLSGTDVAKPVTIRFTLLAPGADGLEGTASTLIARKCDAQLDLLIETVAVAPDTAG